MNLEVTKVVKTMVTRTIGTVTSAEETAHTVLVMAIAAEMTTATR